MNVYLCVFKKEFMMKKKENLLSESSLAEKKNAENNAYNFTKYLVNIISFNGKKIKKKDIKAIYDNLYYAYLSPDSDE